MPALTRWLSCTRCPLHQWRRNVVLGRGDLPAKVLFIGEGPGKSEDVRAEAFVGPSGHLLTRAMADAAALLGGRPLPSAYITNVVACRPCDGPSEPNREPIVDEVAACKPRLALTLAVARPERIVFLGQVAAREARTLCPDGVALVHPAYILRRGGRSSSEYVTFVRELADVFRGLEGE